MEKIGLLWRQFLGNALYFYLWLASQTARWVFHGETNHIQAVESERPAIWAFWHGQGMAFMIYGERFVRGSDFVVIMVGGDRADTLGTLGKREKTTTYAIDMDGNPMASGRAVLNVIKEMKQGKHLLIAPDGPDGPAFVLKKGIGYIARKAQANVLPLGVWTKHGFHLQRWDRYLIPLPFAKIHVVFGEPVPIDKKMSQEEADELIDQALHKARTQAQIVAGSKPW